ncbi:Crp/Fnr family transcriptional regulator [Mycobacterium yunnanensis]|uniref:CRP-like cAMP-activated global transcriptional regulator n=1 Tax=Mycobacterium yunnanensis TaxID=368477 RepID=A0A9X2Z3W3_9MYCO|nr:Crp/Fnr family transcriptional regulator [Mycobacterium yunnanensis]MCV7423145.1 Crp/Fnr family transcriptional regulator [Mycobacterium yunnanensis]
MVEVLAQHAAELVLPAATVELPIRHSTSVSFPRAHTVFAQGDTGDSLYVIVSGKVKVVRRADDGRETLVALMGPTDMFGELAIFDPGPRTSTVTTLTNVEAVIMDGHALRSWVSDNPVVVEQFLGVLARRLRRTNDNVCDLVFTDVPARVARQLLYLGNRFGVREGRSVRIDHELTQEEIAQLAGATRESANRTLVDFARRGWIRRRGKTIFIDNATKLARRAG